jgi:hypothetical protein
MPPATRDDLDSPCLAPTYDGSMGYDLHLTRASDWVEFELEPIALDEWLTFARESSGLIETTEISTGDGVPVFLLGADARSDPALYWSDGQVTVRGADEQHVPALVAEARTFAVHLVGDDGESYP